MPTFQGGPLGGQVGYDPSMDPAPEELAAMAGGGGMGPESGQAPSEPATSKFDRIMQDVMDLAMSDGQVNEEEKLIMQQIGTLVQKLKTNRKKATDQAIAGAPTSSAVGQAYAGG